MHADRSRWRDAVQPHLQSQPDRAPVSALAPTQALAAALGEAPAAHRAPIAAPLPRQSHTTASPSPHPEQNIDSTSPHPSGNLKTFSNSRLNPRTSDSLGSSSSKSPRLDLCPNPLHGVSTTLCLTPTFPHRTSPHSRTGGLKHYYGGP